MKKMILFNPGPTNVSEHVRKEMCAGDMCHREVEVINAINDLNNKIVTIVNGTGSHESVLFASSGTGSNEAVISSIRGEVLVINNGKYSDRLCDIAESYHIPCIRFLCDSDSPDPFDLQRLDENLKALPKVSHVLMVHHETTTGMLAPLKEIGDLCATHNKLLVVDAISSLGGHMIDLRRMNVDFCTVTMNKCLQGFPGISFVIGKVSELEKLEEQSRSYYFDLHRQWKKGRQGGTLFTPPVQLIMAAVKACDELLAEGYENRVNRYRGMARQVKAGLKQLGFEVMEHTEGYESNIVNTVKFSDKFDYWTVHDRLKERGITIYSSDDVLAKGYFRVATMGCIGPDEVEYFLETLRDVMGNCKNPRS